MCRSSKPLYRDGPWLRDRVNYDELFVAGTGFAPYNWQQQLALRAEPARAILAPTGSGKTEAVLVEWLWRRLLHPDTDERRRTARRLVFALPMRVLVEQTIKRSRELLGRLSGAGIVAEDVRVYPLMGGAADDSWILDPAAEAVLVGTIDMLLSRALNRGFGRRRTQWPIDFGLLNSDCLWVFDEVQLMDAAVATSCQLEAFRRRFGVAAPGHTVWMSATLNRPWLQTTDHRAPLDEELAGLGPSDRSGPLGPRLAAPKVLCREQIDVTDAGSMARIVLREHEALADAPEAPALTLALANTVERAVGLYRSLKELTPDNALLLLHSRFRPADRERLVARLEDRLPATGRIVISTQVIEAGIDLDAGALVTELAPWPSIVQRAGRLNRSGARASSAARLVWLDPGERLEELRHPYELEPMQGARAALLELEGGSFAPDEIESYVDRTRERRAELLGPRPSVLHLRAPDLIDLFDTDPTLDGDDPDVGRFIRVDEDLDVGIAWRDLSGDDPNVTNEPLPNREEVCPVPIWDKKELMALSPWRWSYVGRRWEQLSNAGHIVPGDLLLLETAAGGYDEELGWTGRAQDRVRPVGAAGSDDQTDSDADDPQTVYPGRWITIEEHTAHVVAELDRTLASLELSTQWTEALRLAAIAHDTGKAHEEFQRRLRRWAGEGPPDDKLYAKAPDNVRWRPPFAFRHELVSALALLEGGGRSRDLDLAAYLIASHHGKLRLTPRLLSDDRDPDTLVCLGVREGDDVPEVVVDGQSFGPLHVSLSLMRMGELGEATWVDRALDLRDGLGVFRLAYMEALLRAADQSASVRERAR